MNIAIILASGSGKRFGSKVNKVFSSVQCTPIILQTINNFINHDLIDYVLPVIAEKDIKQFKEIVKDISSHKLLPYVIGGSERKYSSFNALKSLSSLNPNFVLIQDGARPFTPPSIISNIINMLNKHPNYGVIPALACLNTIKEVDQNNNVVKTLKRENLIQVQTPQGFGYKNIYNAYCKHIKAPNITDDASIFELAEGTIKAIEGNKNNIKITHKEDIMESNFIFTTGNGFDVHDFCEGNEVILGGIKIPYIKKLKGHSDADVLLHALTDAILGSIAKGDIGDHFPDTDSSFKNMDSNVFLQHACKLLKENNATLINADITIIAEEPKLQNHKTNIKENVAKLLKIPSNKVNIKATTTEKKGFIGRKEGIACIATVSVMQNI